MIPQLIKFAIFAINHYNRKLQNKTLAIHTVLSLKFRYLRNAVFVSFIENLKQVRKTEWPLSEGVIVLKKI
jgi:hypothetical protein